MVRLANPFGDHRLERLIIGSVNEMSPIAQRAHLDRRSDQVSQLLQRRRRRKIVAAQLASDTGGFRTLVFALFQLGDSGVRGRQFLPVAMVLISKSGQSSLSGRTLTYPAPGPLPKQRAKERVARPG